MISGQGIHISRLVFLGKDKEPASINFGFPLSVICGSSDTGKSFVLDAINFLLGSSNPLRDIPQRVGYDRIRLQLWLPYAQEHVTLERSTGGGASKLYEREVADDDFPDSFKVLKEQHKHEQLDTLSGYLLSKAQLGGSRVKKNKAGSTNSLSFRNLVRLILVNENDIIEQRSPFLSGQYTQGTLEYSVLKLLLTGIDDSSSIDTQAVKTADQTAEIRLKVLETLIEELEGELADVVSSEEDLMDQYSRLNATLTDVENSLAAARSSANEALTQRRTASVELQLLEGRIDEIGDLLARFEVLNAHYESDLARLTAMQEAGSFFVHLEPIDCPLCGAAPEAQKHDDKCDGDVSHIIAAAGSEIAKIERLKSELITTRADLEDERDELQMEAETSRSAVNQLTSTINNLLSPQVSDSAGNLRALIDERSEVSRDLDLYKRMTKLRDQRDFEAEDQGAPTANSSITDLSKTILDDFSGYVQDTLQRWNFPGSERVYFDETTKDFVISGKPRGSFGKGFRAITHAAVTVSLMRFCSAREIPHPGFVVMDSPLLSYWEPEGAADSLVGSNLKEKFYEFLDQGHAGGQVIVLENEHPPEKLADGSELEIFTRNPAQGRFGLFPAQE